MFLFHRCPLPRFQPSHLLELRRLLPPPSWHPLHQFVSFFPLYDHHDDLFFPLVYAKMPTFSIWHLGGPSKLQASSLGIPHFHYQGLSNEERFLMRFIQKQSARDAQRVIARSSETLSSTTSAHISASFLRTRSPISPRVSVVFAQPSHWQELISQSHL